MIIKKKRIIFIHINRTGGSSIDSILSSFFNIDIFKRHQSVQEIIERMGISDYRKFYTFTIVRNPWDRLVSKYLWSLQCTKTLNNKTTFKYYVNNISFFRKKERRKRFDAFWDQLSWITHKDEIVVNDVFRFENFRSNAKKIFNKIGVKKYHIPHKKKTNRKHYSLYYNDDIKKKVSELYRRDIDYFDYQFEDKR
ncbi:MAG: sulfotransferase family 2 domain-containing protein [Atribacterota bacterium]